MVQLCVDYMLKHIAKAATQSYLISWLQYSISFSPYHQEVTEACQKFLKWNLDIVSESKDFLDLDVNILIVLLQQNDLVLKSEFELFGYVEKWFMHKNEVIKQEPSLTAEEKQSHSIQILEAVVSHIRFAMMSPNELAKLLLKPIINLRKEVFVDLMAVGMSYHSGQYDRVSEIRNTENGALQFTPRLYTTDIWGLSMIMSEFDKIENYQSFVAYFFSQGNLSEFQEDNNSIAWEIDFFPRGIRYNKAKLINIYNQGNGAEIPEIILRTVRLRVTCRENFKDDRKFKIAVIITGVQNKIHHIRTVHEKIHYFSAINRVLNLDNLLPYNELANSSINLSSHLTGDKRDSLFVNIYIAPMGPYICNETPVFEFK